MTGTGDSTGKALLYGGGIAGKLDEPKSETMDRNAIFVAGREAKSKLIGAA